MGNTAEQSSLVVPDELTGPTPRRASLSDSARRGAVALVFGSVLVLIFTILTARTEIPKSGLASL
jgi:hypothetical protein